MSKEIMLQIIEEFRNMPFLWDRKHKDYKNKNRRNEGYMVLLELYKSLDEDATIKTLTKKLGNLRTNYLKELKKVKDSLRAGGDVYVPTLWYFHALTFLEDTCVNITRDPLESEDHSRSALSDTESDQDSLILSLPSNKKKRMSKEYRHQRQDNMLDAEKTFQMKDEEWEITGKSIGLQLRDLNKKQHAITLKIISDAIYYAKIGALNEHSFIALKPANKDFSYTSPSTSTNKYQESGQSD